MFFFFLCKMYKSFLKDFPFSPPLVSRNLPTPIYGGGGIDLHKFSKYNEITE